MRVIRPDWDWKSLQLHITAIERRGELWDQHRNLRQTNDQSSAIAFDGTEGSSQSRRIYDELDDGGDVQYTVEDDNVGYDGATDEVETTDLEGAITSDELSGDEERDILDMEVEEYKDVNNNAVQPSTTVTISDVHSQERPTVRLISSKEAESIRWLLFKVMHSLDNVGFSLLRQIPQIEAQSLYTCRKLISDCAALSPVKYDCCHLRPCVCYFGEYEGYQVCPKCGAERFAKYSSKPNKTFTYIPLEPRIRAIFSQKQLSKIVQEYPSEVMSKTGILADFWNGDIIKRLRADGIFIDPTEIALALSIDGVQLVKTKTHQTWPIMGIMMNLPPSMRYKKENLLLFGTIPGPKMPGDVFSFLGPFLKEIKNFSENGVKMWNENLNCMSIVKVHLCLITGDQPAMAKLMCLKGHNARRPCRFCFIEGVVASNRQNYYPFSSLVPDAQGIRCLNLRNDMKGDIEACNQQQDPALYRELGISDRSPLVDVKTLYWPQSFPVDVMHSILEGIVPRTFEIWIEASKTSKRGQELRHGTSQLGQLAKPLVEDLAGLGADIKESAREVPAALARSPENIHQHYRSYRAHNWFDFLQLFAHPLLDGRASLEVRKNLALLARIYSVSTQEELTEEDIRYLEGAVLEFVKSYENLYSDPTVCTSNLHGILHLADCVKNCGPAWGYWQFTMEKTCGNVVSWLKGNKLKDESLSNAILLQQQVNLIRWQNPNTCLSWEEVFMQDRAISTLTGLIDKVKRPPEFTDEQWEALAAYFDVQPPSAAMIHEMQKTMVHFRKYRANREDIVTSALVTARPESRCSRYVSCQNHENERYFGEVDRLFSCTWHRKDHQLALVKVFDEVRYTNNQDEIYGRVQTLKSRKSYLVCICLANIECTVGITYNRFTKQEYILDRNWTVTSMTL